MGTSEIIAEETNVRRADARPDLSVIIISFNTQDVLRICLEKLRAALHGLSAEVIVVDNNSSDRSADMVEREFPEARLIRSSVNTGFAAANNIGFRVASGRFLVLLNSDAYVDEAALRRSLAEMESDPEIGAGGGRLVGIDGSWQPSARRFPSLLNSVLTLTGLAARYPRSRFFGRGDRTWADANSPADADWVPGAFTIIRAEALKKVGQFDESFFLYSEEVDLCRRLRRAGYRVRYFPDVVVVHLGGESSKTHRDIRLSTSGRQLALWRLRSDFLYYRKHHGHKVWFAMSIEKSWHRLRLVLNLLRGDSGKIKAEESGLMIALIRQAWSETAAGRVSPPRPW
jgi:GT2 family glycosyltransferase